MDTVQIETALSEWIAGQLPDADDVRLEGLDRVEFGHSAEMMILTVLWRTNGDEHRQDVVLRLRPPAPGLLEPYDLERQYDIIRALGDTPVKAPRALWVEPTGDVLGRPFFVMERVGGEVFERDIPADLAADPERVLRMSESLVDQIAAIHAVDLDATGLGGIGDGSSYIDRELDHWAAEMRRVQRGPLPGLELLLAALQDQRPAPNPNVTLVHGDTKPGNFAFVDGDVSAVFDWEMTDVGDPLADLGWTELTWMSPTFTCEPSSLTADGVVARWEELTGMVAQHRHWYRALAGFKMNVILLLGGMLVDAGHSDDLRFVEMASVVPLLTCVALQELGIMEEPESGPVLVRTERIEQIKARRAESRAQRTDGLAKD